MTSNKNVLVWLAMWGVRLGLAASFLSAVADRLGLWGAAGTPGVVWGGFGPFLEYTGTLLWFLPSFMIFIVGWIATGLEFALAVLLLAGYKVRAVAVVSGVLLLTFAISMTVALGAEPAFSYSVWTAAAAAFLLAAVAGKDGEE